MSQLSLSPSLDLEVIDLNMESTPIPNDTSSPSTPLSLSFTTHRLISSDSMSSISSYVESPILRDFEELTLSLTDHEDEQNEDDDDEKVSGSQSTKQTKVRFAEIEDEENPFLMGLEIKIPSPSTSGNKMTGFPIIDEDEMEIISEDDEDDDEYLSHYFVDEDDPSDYFVESDCYSFFDDTLDIERKFKMKQYKYLTNIGIGAFGIVDQVLHRKTNRFVAIKQSRSIGDEILKQFKNEFDILHQFANCEYIIDLVDYGFNVNANQICLALEYMDIGSLKKINNYSMPQIKYITFCILMALHELHEKLYVHNDIKPDNILISSDGKVKLIDFGCTMKMKQANEPLTKSIGSIRYLSFEKRFMSPIRYGTKSDIYSLGITISELFNGEHVDKKTPYNTYFMTTSPKLKNNHNPLFTDFVAKCIDTDPDKRWSAAQLLQHPFLSDTPSAQTMTF